jgi:uncharacterized membrane protein YqjE
MNIESETGTSDQPNVPDTSETIHENQSKNEEEQLVKTLADQLMGLSGQAALVAKELSELFRLELQLSVGDARRLLLTWLALLPAVILAWISIGALIAWIVYDISSSVTLALSAFTLLQVSLCTTLLLLRKRFRSGLGFRRTKAHAKRLLKEITDDTTTAN